ncbi:MAG: ParM/StbA family protein [Halomonadaceae bacterium]|nr:ParM/StbA family protein [Halomonadaceae bacterium]
MHLLSVSDADDIETLEEGLVIVLDPGYFSVDWVAMQGRSLRKGSSGTSHKAMSRVLEEASRLICVDVDSDNASSKEALENAVRNGKETVLVFGERIEIKPFLEKAIKAVAPQAMSSLRQAVREEERGADIVLLAGGGGEVFSEVAREAFPRSRIVVPESPVMANARGFWFYGS